MMIQDDNAAAYIVAFSQALQDLFSILHQIEPEEVESKLRTMRLMVQETNYGRHHEGSEGAADARQIYLDLLERSVSRSRGLAETD